ncbi:ABC transporter permease [Saccharothrix deserti]|uniref:ABC transporter permease n=1 Tax=Saccharothrix deserti TaxID=2593674 RepID=UPI00131E0554|nr:ABC transporter permease [Saccharothrix deserti]
MTTATATAPTTTAAPARPAYKVTWLRVLRSEWTKFWSVRSSPITLVTALFLLVGIGAIASLTFDPAAAPGGNDGPPITDGAISLALMGTIFASLAIGVLGVLVSAGEYSTGMIRATLAAVPKRLPTSWAKTAVFGVVATIVTAAGALGAFLLGAAILDGEAIAMSLGDDGVLRVLAGTGIYLGLVGMWGVALGALLRSSAGGIAVLVGMLLIVPGLSSLLPASIADNVTPYLPSNAGQAVTHLNQAADSLGPWTGVAVFAGWVAVTLVAAAYRLARRDA